MEIEEFERRLHQTTDYNIIRDWVFVSDKHERPTLNPMNYIDLCVYLGKDDPELPNEYHGWTGGLPYSKILDILSEFTDKEMRKLTLHIEIDML